MTTNEKDMAAEETALCMHVIGIGRTGAVYVEALLRTGEVEDHLANPLATFAAMVVDIGDQDLGLAQDYGASFYKRLESRGIPTERFSFQSIAIDPPSADGFDKALTMTPDFLKAEGAKAPKEFKPYVPKGTAMPKSGEHFPRAVAKGIYASAFHAGEKPMDAALDAFVAQVNKASLPSVVAVCFSLAGGTGSGIMVDLTRHLAKKLGSKVTVMGVGQLPHSGDPDTYKNSAALYTTLNDLDCMLDEDKNAAIMAAYGEIYRSPFTGGFFVVNPEQSWQRLTAYTTTGEARIRQAIKEMVTNRFVADSFMRWCVACGGRDLKKVLRPAKLTDSKHETVGAKSRNWTMFDVAKLTHPGVQVLPGEAPSKWEAVIAQWIDFTPKYDGLKDDFRTDFAHVAIYGSRNMAHEVMIDGFKKMVKTHYLTDGAAELPMSVIEFFDVLTAYANVVLLGVAKTDLEAFWESQKTFEALSGEEKLKEHAWLIDVGPMLSDPAARFDGLPSQCRAEPVVPFAAVHGDKLPPDTRKGDVAAAAAM